MLKLKANRDFEIKDIVNGGTALTVIGIVRKGEYAEVHEDDLGHGESNYKRVWFPHLGEGELFNTLPKHFFEPWCADPEDTQEIESKVATETLRAWIDNCEDYGLEQKDEIKWILNSYLDKPAKMLARMPEGYHAGMCYTFHWDTFSEVVYITIGFKSFNEFVRPLGNIAVMAIKR